MNLDGKLVVLVGGSGFVGRHLAQVLLARGARLRVASRFPEHSMAVKPLSNLGQVQLARCDVTVPDSLGRIMAGADAVVSLVGTFTGDLDATMGRGAGAVAAAAHAASAAALVHVSAIGAGPEGETAYARAKAAGEQAVREAFPTAMILRPSALFGPDDNFLNLLGGFTSLPVLPVIAPQARLQPLFVDDCAEAIARGLETSAASGGKTFELGGPEAVKMIELNRRLAASCGRTPLLVEIPDAVSGAIASLTGWLPGAPLTRQQWLLLKAGNVVSGTLPGCQELGLTPRPMGLFLDRWMTRFRKHGRFGDRAAA
jgi:NADH dehydrogenase